MVVAALAVAVEAVIAADAVVASPLAVVVSLFRGLVSFNLL